jgi:alginate O-acetyltransferase complex protein AlgI
MNLFTTMLLGGFWHGASFNFLIWGALHGIGLAVHKLWMMGPGGWIHQRQSPSRWYRLFMLVLTFHFVCLGWVFFKAGSLELAGSMLHQITHDFSFTVWPAFFGNYKTVVFLMVLAFLLHAIPDNWMTDRIGRFSRLPLIVYLLIFTGFALLYGVFKSAEPVMPIYLQF